MQISLACFVPVVNHLLRQNSVCQRHLKAQAGKVLALRLSSMVLCLTIQNDGFVLLAPNSTLADVTISLKMSALMPLILGWAFASPSQKQQTMQKIMALATLEGDAELAACVSYLVNHLRWDLEDDLSKIFGDSAAVGLMRLGSQAGHFASDSFRRLSQSFQEYVVYERAWVVPQDQLDFFADQVRQLRDDVERLEKRINRLNGGA
jgi:ubiquinone biosynthesis accessory factor UbiJ